jgi:hypothetical protein
MKLQTTNSPSAEQPRCKQCTSNGRRCRLRALDSRSGLCFRHASLQNTLPDAIDLTSDFGELLSDFQSAQGINAFLAKLTAVVVQNRISSRRAAVLAYISYLMLNTLPTIDLEEELLELQRTYRQQMVQDLIQRSADREQTPPDSRYVPISDSTGLPVG